jgi:hypothetical protein
MMWKIIVRADLFKYNIYININYFLKVNQSHYLLCEVEIVQSPGAIMKTQMYLWTEV